MFPDRRRMELISVTLNAFCGDPDSGQAVDDELLTVLGAPTEEKKWLAASLAKTIRLQLDPPDDLRSISALAGPEWLTRHNID